MKVRFDDRLFMVDRKFHFLGMSNTFAQWICGLVVAVVVLSMARHVVGFIPAALVALGVGYGVMWVVKWRVDHERPLVTYLMLGWFETVGWWTARTPKPQSLDVRVPRRRR